MANYFIGVGGTGARCAEAAVYLAAAGILDSDLHVLVIDPDANNGNASVAGTLLSYYHQIHREHQPRNPTIARRFKLLTPFLAGVSPTPVIFKPDLNHGGESPALWNVRHHTDRRFEELLAYTSFPGRLKSFVDLFFQPDDLKMELKVGYQGRTNVGSVALKQSLEESQQTSGSGFKEFLERLTADLQNQKTKVFVAGSVFGGTGATGIPTIPALLKTLDENILPTPHRANLVWGAAFMAPYFIFPRDTSPSSGVNGPGTDSTRHPIATQAALLHYAGTPPPYKQVYLIGAPHRGQTNDENFPGGSEQRNLPHYAELVAALAAWDFYDTKEVLPDGASLHYADSYDNEQDQQVNWTTLPLNEGLSEARRAQLKRRLVAFTTFAYVYHNILHHEFINNRSYRDSDTYKDNFHNLSLEGRNQQESLEALNNFCGNFLTWLRDIGRTGGTDVVQLFNWDAFDVSDVASCAQRVGNLISVGTRSGTRAPKFSTNGYEKITEKLNQIRLDSPNTESAVGLFIFLLYEAVNQFCVENYDLR